jgi:hypothetical protein
MTSLNFTETCCNFQSLASLWTLFKVDVEDDLIGTSQNAFRLCYGPRLAAPAPRSPTADELFDKNWSTPMPCSWKGTYLLCYRHYIVQDSRYDLIG